MINDDEPRIGWRGAIFTALGVCVLWALLVGLYLWEW
jgi:hypothetical protein